MCGAGPELLKEVDISRGGDELNEVFVGGSIGVGLLLLLRLLLPLLQLRQKHPVDGVWVAQHLHQRLQHWRQQANSQVIINQLCTAVEDQIVYSVAMDVHCGLEGPTSRPFP